ncbi:hypothetical protein ABT261_49405, partial [Amycolatopsis sp. NPDC000740]
MTTASVATKPRVPLRARLGGFDQTYLVLGITVLLALAAGATTTNFLTAGNFGSILNLSAAFGILAIGEAIVVLGKGLDLSVAGIGLGCAQATLAFISEGMPEWQAITLMTALALAIGLVNGVLVAVFEVPALFVTLATGMLAIGGIDILFLIQNVYGVPAGSFLSHLSGGSVLGVPRPVLIAGGAFLL